MKINKIKQQPCFKGYKNVISSNMFINGHANFSFITMQLNDKGNKDLTALREIRTFYKDTPKDDILTLIHVKSPYQQEKLYFDERSMYLGNELYILKEDIGKTSAYKTVEEATLKAYSFMANITRRMKEDKQVIVDLDFPKVFMNIMRNFNESLSSSQTEVVNLLAKVIRRDIPLDRTASILYDLVIDNMNKFLKL